MSRGKHLNFQHSFWGVIQEVTNHCMWTITLVGVILCDKRILLERQLPYTLKSANKQLTHALLHFVASLQRRFYTLAPIPVLYVSIYSSSLRLFKTDLLVSLLSATHGQCLILVLCLPLSWLRVTFVLNTLIALKELFFRPVTWRKYLGLTSLWFCRDIARNTDFRQRYLCLLEVVDKICCLRPTRIRLHNSKWFKQNGLLLNVETGSHELAILSHATVCLHPSVSLNNEKICREFSEHKIAVCEKTAGLRSGNSSDWNSACLKVLVPVEIFQFSDMHYETERYRDSTDGLLGFFWFLLSYSNQIYIALSGKGSVTYWFCPRETSYGRSSGDPPPHPP